MTKDEKFLYVQAAHLEFERLCRKLGHHDPYLTAFGMTERLVAAMREIEQRCFGRAEDARALEFKNAEDFDAFCADEIEDQRVNKEA